MEELSEADLVFNFEPEPVKDPNFAKYAQISADGYKIE